MLENDVGKAMVTASDYTNDMYLREAANIAQKDTSQHKIRFIGTFDEVSMTKTVQTSLLALVLMVEHGSDVESQTENGVSDSDLVSS